MLRTATFGLLLTIGALLACAGASSTKVGRDTFAIDCHTSRKNCYQEAAKVCPYGFDIADSSDKQGAIVTPVGDSAVVTPTYQGEMLVRCKPK